MSETVYKICPRQAWQEAEKGGVFKGAPIDLEDGYIHFSTGAQVVETATKHFAGQRDLVLVAVHARDLGDDLKWEPSRGGQHFPHLYAPLPTSVVQWVRPLPLGGDGRHSFPQGVLP